MSPTLELIVLILSIITMVLSLYTILRIALYVKDAWPHRSTFPTLLTKVCIWSSIVLAIVLSAVYSKQDILLTAVLMITLGVWALRLVNATFT